MKFIQQQIISPGNKELFQLIEKAATELEKQLLTLNIYDLPISDYTKQYYSDHLNKLRYSLQASCFLLLQAIHDTGKKPEQLILVDNGGGVGIFSFLAKKAGISTVIFNDIYDVSCKDAVVIAKHLGISIDHYITGDVDELIEEVKVKGLNVNVVISRNVIEHIYNLDLYFKKIKTITPDALTLVFATTANTKNLLVELYTRRIHRRIEYQDQKQGWGVKETDAKFSHYKIRKEIILELAPALSIKEIEKLTRSTRGLAGEDIQNAVTRYLDRKEHPPKPDHSTNTCDPNTGNWAEHLVSFKQYQIYFQQNGFSFEVIPGFYNTNYSLKMLNIITPIINKLIFAFPKFGLFLAPFIVLVGKRD